MLTSSLPLAVTNTPDTTKVMPMASPQHRKTLSMINEFDLADYEQLPLRELYKTKPRSYIKLPWVDGMDGDIVFFDHIDGMYSYCLSMNNELIHLSAFAEVIPLVKKANPD